jgi:glutamine synthetase adenylyltransferase
MDGNPKMLTTMIFRLYPSDAQIHPLNETFAVYNRMKRKGYQLLFKQEPGIQQKLMQVCQNNPYVNTIMTENQTKLEQQNTWLKNQTKLEPQVEHRRGGLLREHPRGTIP